MVSPCKTETMRTHSDRQYKGECEHIHLDKSVEPVCTDCIDRKLFLIANGRDSTISFDPRPANTCRICLRKTTGPYCDWCIKKAQDARALRVSNKGRARSKKKRKVIFPSRMHRTYRTTEVSRKTWVCEYCGGRIKPGEIYGQRNGSQTVKAAHIKCAESDQDRKIKILPRQVRERNVA